MSKVVRKIANIAAGGKFVVKAVRKVWRTKIGRMAAIAAASFFVGPAAMGLMGIGGAAAAGGLSGLSGAMANVSAAWAGLGTAASSAVAGNFATAASQLGTAASGGLIGDAANGIAAAAPTTMESIGSNVASQGFKLAANGLGAEDAGVMNASMGGSAFDSSSASQSAPQIGSGSYNFSTAGSKQTPGAFSLANYLDTRGGAAAVQVGGQIISGLGQGISAQSAQDHQDKLAGEARSRYNTNMGTRLWPTKG
jgi:hypothetical protein